MCELTFLCDRFPSEITGDAFYEHFIVFMYLFCVPLCKHLVTCFTEIAFQKTELDLDLPLIVKHSTQEQILQTFTRLCP